MHPQRWASCAAVLHPVSCIWRNELPSCTKHLTSDMLGLEGERLLFSFYNKRSVSEPAKVFHLFVEAMRAVQLLNASSSLPHFVTADETQLVIISL